MRNFVKYVLRTITEKRAHAELSALSTATLNDIGIYRSDISYLAREEAVRKYP
jgi:uncharacterized protein YjiS (DUF1127 family)